MTDTRTRADLVEENNDLLELVDNVWDAVVDTDGSSSKQELLEATENVADLLNEFDSDEFVIEGPPADADEGAA